MTTAEIFYSDKIEYFNKLGPNWDEEVGNDDDRKSRIEKTFERISINEGDRVLDVGCGNGIVIPFIAKKTGPNGKITAIDAAPEMVNTAAKKFASLENATFMPGILEEVNLEDNSFDVIVAFAVFPHIENRQKALGRMKKLLSENGRLYIFQLSDSKSLNDFHSKLEGPVSRDVMPPEDEMRKLLTEAGFTVKVYIDETGLNFIEAV